MRKLYALLLVIALGAFTQCSSDDEGAAPQTPDGSEQSDPQSPGGGEQSNPQTPDSGEQSNPQTPDGSEQSDPQTPDSGEQSDLIQASLNTGTSILDLLKEVPKEALYGKTYEGGLIFYVNEIDGTGLVAAPTDQAIKDLNTGNGGAPWGCYGRKLDGADGEAIGTGAQNTLDILAGCSEQGTAAQLCADLVLNEKEDWFLPSLDELRAMYVNLHQNGFGGFTPTMYWSGTEYNPTGAYLFIFDLGFYNTYNKAVRSSVRAVRAF